MEDIEATIGFALDSGADTAYFGNYLPLPGSEDFERLVHSGDLDPDGIDWDAYTAYYGKIPYHPPAVSKKELLKAVKSATYRFYLRPKTLWGLLKRMSHPVFIQNLFFRVSSLFLSPRKSHPKQMPESGNTAGGDERL